MSRRRRGGLPRDIDYLLSSLATKDKRKWQSRLSALHQVAGMIRIACARTITGERYCGYFLAELLAFLAKNQLRLVASNPTFRETWFKWESARTSTTKGSPLRRLVHEIIADAQRARSAVQIAEYLPHVVEPLKLDTRLSKLPDLGPSPEIVEQWFKVIVYPRLHKMRRRLAADPEIGAMKKALDKNGKFQLSRLKPLIRDTVARIAALPELVFFDIT